MGIIAQDTSVSAAALAVVTGKQTIPLPAPGWTPTTTNGCASIASAETTADTHPDIIGLAFDPTADEACQITIPFNKAWDEGTLTFRVFWTTTGADTDGVAWALHGVACSDGDAITSGAYGTPVVVTDNIQSVANDQLVTAESAAVTIAGTPAEGDLCYFRFFRDVSDAADTAAEDCIMQAVHLYYTTDAGNDA